MNRRTRDPYEHVAAVLRQPDTPAVTARQMLQAATCAAAMLAALGIEPAVDGDATHRTALAGQGLLDMLRAGLTPATPRGGGTDAPTV